MLSDGELKTAEGQLQEFRLADEKHSQTSAEILSRYAQLMENYKRLKSDYEEERDSREKYKQMAKGQEKNPFALVLVDGDGYIFDDDLVSSGHEGGARAAQFLNDIVKASLDARGLGHCRIMVRIYANLSGLSKALSKVKLAGPEKRSLAPFVANFNRSHDLFDFVDAGELKENADSKIRSLFNMYADNTQCKHIYFAACHDVGYINELARYSRDGRDRITLVRTHSFHREFAKLGLRIEDFPHLFRSLPLDPSTPGPTYQKPVPTAPGYQKSAPPPSYKHQSNNSNDFTANICTFFQKGSCRYGSTCKFLHTKSNNNSNGYSASSNIGNISDWRKDASSNKSLPLHSPIKSDTDFMRGNVSIPNQTQADLLATLPREENLPPGKIPVNGEQHRIDCFITPSTYEDRASFNSRTAKRKVCNNFHLKGHCASGDSCPYDHSPITDGIKSYLKEVTRGMPCTRRGACRNPQCFQGHICQQLDCRRRGGKVHCKLPYPMHTVDLTVVDFVDGVIITSKDASGWDENGSVSPPTSTTQEEEDSEGEEQSEGATFDQSPDTELSVD